MGRTRMMKTYMFKLIIRIGIFVAVFVDYLFFKRTLLGFLTHKFTFGFNWPGISAMHVLWAVFMLMMISHIIPHERVTMAIGKAKEENYVEDDEYREIDLLRYVKMMNLSSWKVLLVWLCFNSIWGFLYLFHVIDDVDLIMITVFYFLCDYICILFFCPLQQFIMKNKCCVNCRIYDWGHFMMFTPMLFIRDFFSWSLFFTSLIVLLRWEIRYAKHPEYFWEGSNVNLRCINCKDTTCTMKKKITGKLFPPRETE